MLYDKINKHEKIYILHWSNADKYIIDKTLQKYQKLNEFYKSVCEPNLQYIDLLKLTKSSIKLESYSLKHVAKTLLDIDYNTDCKNGFDAMCSIIQNNNKLTSKDKELCDFTSTKDIIQYNKLDTELLYYILNYFLKFKV
jgi:DNA polymerase elongation subunit (family B)